MTTGLAITIIAVLGAITGGIAQRFIRPLWLVRGISVLPAWFPASVAILFNRE